MSTTIGGDLPGAQKAPPNGAGTQVRKQRKQRAKRGARTASAAPAAQPTPPAARAAPAKKPRRMAARTAQVARTIPIGIGSGANVPDLLTGFIQSMPKAGTQLAAEARDACKTTFASLIDWIYPATKAA